LSAASSAALIGILKLIGTFITKSEQNPKLGMQEQTDFAEL